MMLDFEVNVSPEEFDVTRSGSVVGPIWVRVAGADFPEPGWHDFPVKLLGGWLTTLSTLDAGRSDPAVLLFMEGPYELEVSREREAGADAWVLLARQYGNEIVVKIAVKAVADLLAPLRAAAARALITCHEHGWHGPDVAYLESVAHR